MLNVSDHEYSEATRRRIGGPVEKSLSFPIEQKHNEQGGEHHDGGEEPRRCRTCVYLNQQNATKDSEQSQLLQVTFLQSELVCQ